MNLQRIALSIALAVLLPALSFSVKQPLAKAGVSGQYKNIKVPYARSESRQVTGTHDRVNGRHAIDFGMNYEDVLAIRAGKVYRKAWDSTGGGNILIIDHGDNFCSNYFHLNQFYDVDPGTPVQQGQRIAQSGASGNVQGAHLHLSVTEKVNGVCSANQDREIAMIFDEVPTRELNYPEFVPSTPFVSPVSKLTISPSTVDLTISAANLSGKTVSVQMWRPAVGGYPAKEFPRKQLTATGNSITFQDIDGDGPTLAGVTYYTVTSLSGMPSGEAAKQRTSCFSATGGQYLCDAVRR